MITSPSQWQIDNMRERDQIVITKKSFSMKLTDLISGIAPELITVKLRYRNGEEHKEVIDRRLVTIVTQEEINSKISSPIGYTVVNKNGQLTSLRNGVVSASINQLCFSVDNKIYSFPIDVIEQCIEKSKRKFNLLNKDSESLDYDYVSETSASEFDFNGKRYEFKNGISFKLIMYRLRDDSDQNKDKYMLVENLFKLSVSGNDSKELTNKLLEILSDRIDLALTKSNDKHYNSFLLDETLDNVIQKYVKVVKLNNEDNEKENTNE